MNDWLATDAELLKNFLNSETGKKLLQIIEEQTPVVAPNPQEHLVVFQAGLVQGWRGLASVIRSLTEFKPTEQQTIEELV